MRRLPPHLAPLGYSPRRYKPLSPAPVLGMGERLTDLREMQLLFANGELGGYWPADPAYAFEDSAGTTAASVNGVVGLWFNVSKGLELGPELVTNGAFDSADGWTLASGVTISDGKLNFNTTSNEYARYTLSGLAIANAYLVTLDLVSRTRGAPFISIGGSGGITKSIPIAVGTKSVVVIAGGSHSYFYIYGGVFSSGGAGGGDAVIDNISIKQILGNHAVQATTANKPYLRRTPTTGKYWYDSNTATGALTATFSGALGSACTIATVTPEGVTIAENQTVGATYNICPAYGYNSDVLIINRALTPAEKALVTRVMQRSVPTLGSELVTNGGFDTDLSGWTYTVGQLEWRNGAAHKTTGSTANFTQPLLVNGQTYIGKAVIKNYVSGSVQLLMSTTYDSGNKTSNSSIVGVVTSAANTSFNVYTSSASSDFDIDDASLKAIL